MQGDGHPVHKDRPGFVKKAINILGSKLWKNTGRGLGEMPMRMLIAQELPTAIELKEKTPSIVAKLMGLNSWPCQQKIPACRRILQESDSHHRSRALHDNQQLEKGNYGQIKYGSELQIHQNMNNDVFEVKRQYSSNDNMKNDNIHHGDYHGSLTERRMALVRQKFIEAKRLATNERLLQSKEFKDALEVLHSNKDLFLKLLEDPNSLFSNQLEDLHQTTASRNQTKCITVLKPTTSIDIDHEKCVRKNPYNCGEQIGDNNRHEISSCGSFPKPEAVAQPTKIVVLKAISVMPHETQTNLIPHVSVPIRESRNFNENLVIDCDRRSAEGDNEIINEDSSSTQKDEYQRASSVLSNGYVADESSLSKSETDSRGEGGSNCSDSDMVTPTSQNSWVLLKSDSPNSLSSFSKASLKSSANREATKRLSERWESVASNQIIHGPKNFRKSSNTLGEMLAIPEVKIQEEGGDRFAISPCDSSGQVHHLRMANPSSPSHNMQEESDEESPKNFTPSSKSPASPDYESEDNSCTLSSKSISPIQVPKMKNETPSLKNKVSGLFFSSVKKLARIKPGLSNSITDGRHHWVSFSAVKNERLQKSSLVEIASRTLANNFAKSLSSSSVSGTEKQGNVSLKRIHTVEKLWKFNQPSYPSVLERQFQDDFVNTFSNSSQRYVAGSPQALSRSPLISSVSRSLKFEPTYFESAQPNSLKLSRLFSKEDDEQERFDFISNLLSSSNFANENSTTLIYKLHSMNSPLDSNLLDEFKDLKGEEAKCRERRSSQRLYFDSVNAALKDICSHTLVNSYPWSNTATRARKHVNTNLTVTDAVWCRLNNCFSETENWTSNKAENSNQYLNCLVKNEVAGCEWAELMWFEMDELSKEFAEKVLDELFDDALADLTWCFL